MARVSFLALPAELRVKIYKYLLSREVPYSHWAGLRCCKTIRNEFDFKALKDMRRFYAASSTSCQLLIAPQTMAQIATLRIQILKSGMLQTHHRNRQINIPWH
jgi:hypothetical protein